jgi:23S rRNA (cytosine1962-C5)-methyltransferase
VNPGSEADPGGYALLDSGDGAKLERFGNVVLARPCAQACWRPSLPREAWQRANASFSREGGNRWVVRDRLPEQWTIDVDGSRFRLSTTDFGHLGIFPEQRPHWRRLRAWARARRDAGQPARVLNLFAYSGGGTLAPALGGADVCHLDASKGMVDWARDNARLNGLENAPIRWIVDDVHKFLEREIRRERRYEAIVLDPPSFGRGRQGEVFKIERDLPNLLARVARLLSEDASLVLLSAHTPELTPIGLGHLLEQAIPGRDGTFTTGEMLLEGDGALPVPSGGFACWSKA